ncbi:expressed unknown protein [Seminavis robusta]|uniref:Uncharacterized protein n=1 Tax=Seminavis robusta TaxID=568900 RepID=A0A9N8EEW6_9STRA|nr:expressed unknown protein [Seminavis robusta]|eukprot:Sro836_g209040.1 n/a (636) ;mRNA; r:33829-35843
MIISGSDERQVEVSPISSLGRSVLDDEESGPKEISFLPDATMDNGIKSIFVKRDYASLGSDIRDTPTCSPTSSVSSSPTSLHRPVVSSNNYEVVQSTSPPPQLQPPITMARRLRRGNKKDRYPQKSQKDSKSSHTSATTGSTITTPASFGKASQNNSKKTGHSHLYGIILVLLLMIYTIGLFYLRLKMEASEIEQQLDQIKVPQGWRQLDSKILEKMTTSTNVIGGTTTNNDENSRRTVRVQRHAQIRFPQVDKNDDSTMVLFYHIYLPQPDPSEALRIIREQLQQIASYTPPGKQVLLLYTTIGDRHALLPEKMHNWCTETKLECRRLQHYDVGREELTLQMVNDFCQQQPADYRIGYLHNKGSHHPSPLNEQWRRLMTHAVMKEDCWPSKQKNYDNCNVCGLYFTFDRGLFMAGNVWTATCGYVQQLMEPRYFEPNMTEIVTKAWVQSVKYGTFGYTQYPQEPPFLGLDRYAAEWWIGSHPTIEPCDYSGTIPKGVGYDRTKQFLKLVWDTTGLNMTSNFTFVAGPRFPGQRYKLPKGSIYNRQKMGGEDPDYWKKEYFLLPGIVYRWIQLYQQLPGPNSWVWRHFPHGDLWKRSVQQYGLDVMDRIHDDDREEGTTATASSAAVVGAVAETS